MYWSYRKKNEIQNNVEFLYNLTKPHKLYSIVESYLEFLDFLFGVTKFLPESIVISKEANLRRERLNILDVQIDANFGIYNLIQKKI